MRERVGSSGPLKVCQRGAQLPSESRLDRDSEELPFRDALRVNSLGRLVALDPAIWNQMHSWLGVWVPLWALLMGRPENRALRQRRAGERRVP